MLPNLCGSGGVSAAGTVGRRTEDTAMTVALAAGTPELNGYAPDEGVSEDPKTALKVRMYQC